MQAHRAIDVGYADRFIGFPKHVFHPRIVAFFDFEDGDVRGADIRRLVFIIGLVPVARLAGHHVSSVLFRRSEYGKFRPRTRAYIYPVARAFYVRSIAFRRRLGFGLGLRRVVGRLGRIVRKRWRFVGIRYGRINVGDALGGRIFLRGSLPRGICFTADGQKESKGKHKGDRGRFR